MKIHDKGFFAWGVGCLCALLLFAFGIIKAAFWQWIIVFTFGASFFHIALSKSESERHSRIEKSYRRVSQELYGKHVAIKTNLPWIIAGGFIVVALFVKFMLDIIIPEWIVICFIGIFLVSVFYSIGLERKIIEHIDKETETDSNTVQ